MGIAVILVVIVAVAAVSSYFLLIKGEEAPPGEEEEEEETYELFFDYEVGEYYNYETTTTTTSIQDNTETETSSSSAYFTQVTAVEDDEISIKYIGTETLDGENVEMTLVMTMSKRGEMLSWEIENVVPPEYWEQVSSTYEGQMVYQELLGLEFPEGAIPIGHEWESSIETEIPMGPEEERRMVPLTGEISAQFVGEESVPVEAGTFDCWRIEHSASVSGEKTVDNQYTLMVDITVGGIDWLNKQNCVQIKSMMSWSMSGGVENYFQFEYLSESVTELVEYGTV